MECSISFCVYCIHLSNDLKWPIKYSLRAFGHLNSQEHNGSCDWYVKGIKNGAQAYSPGTIKTNLLTISFSKSV